MNARQRLLVKKARIRARQRQLGTEPWYEKTQVDLPIQLAELRRLYWRALKRQQRGRPVPGMDMVKRLMADLRGHKARPDQLQIIRRAVRALTDVSDEG